MTYDEWAPLNNALNLLSKRNGAFCWYSLVYAAGNYEVVARKCHICNQAFEFKFGDGDLAYEAFQEHGIQHLKEAGLLAFV